MVKSLPHHFRQVSELPTLTEPERESLAKSEAAIEMLELSYWAAGKALQIIRDGRLYRATHDTFEAYLEARWRMKRAYANKLIRSWPVAQAVFESKSNGLAPMGAKDAGAKTPALPYRSAWELVPAAEKLGVEAAEQVWGIVLEVDGKPTSATVRQAVQAVKDLPPGPFDPKVARKTIHTVLAAEKPARKPTARKAAVPPQAGTEQSAATPAIPWKDPAALYGLLREHMTREDRSELLELLLQEATEHKEPASV
ncbi:hypothetical protein AB0D10_38065 [Kitasatospora sp. NPDC048545]|uniref:hypothetical protein n=1 Tax=Kitasatospora sp. NPDC048545 TaxID=3157208 RepID=UPI0033F56305